jgi:hypothetical protein
VAALFAGYHTADRIGHDITSLKQARKMALAERTLSRIAAWLTRGDGRSG